MKKPDFEDFLATKHAEQAVGVLDDDMPDDFNAWMENIDQEELIKFANQYACEYGKLVLSECRKVFVS